MTSPPPLIVGIDPGLTGAFALVDVEGGLWDVDDLEGAAGRLMPGRLISAIGTWRPSAAVIERVGPMRGQGVSTSWKFARAYGAVEGVVEALGIPSHEITPAVWKRRLGLPRDKSAARAEACRRWPERREWFARARDAGRAEAALLVVAWLEPRVQHSAT